MSRRKEEASGALLDLFQAAGRLKGERRKGWVLKLGMADPESVADHSFRTALIAMVYSDLRGLDTAKVLRMALLHDLSEAVVGDSTPGERTPTLKLRLESAAMKKILEKLPTEQRTRYWRIWLEFNGGTSEEARLARQVDKLEMAMQAAEYGMANKELRTAEFIESARAAIQDEDLVQMLGLVSRMG